MDKPDQDKSTKNNMGSILKQANEDHVDTLIQSYVVYPSGDRYFGTISSNRLMHGKGKMIYPNRIYEGEWKQGEGHGKGKLTFQSGSTYIGEHSNSSYEGFGTYYYNNGDTYQGEFKNGKKHGHGTYYWVHGDSMQGQFFERKVNGFYRWNDGRKQQGVYDNDTRNNRGIFIAKSGDVFEMIYENGLLKSSTKL